MGTEVDDFIDEAVWLAKNPEFRIKPASVREFLGPDYLNLDRPGKKPGIRPKVSECLVEIFGEEVDGFVISKVRRAMFTGSIGCGKTTFASVVIPYMVHWVKCLNDPQDFFGLIPGSRIAFMMMSTSENQAKEVLFGDIKARIEHSPWFKDPLNSAIPDPKFTNQLRFEGDIWVLPGSSKETSFEGYNILGGILDEGDSHKTTDDKDYAEEGYDTIHSRIASRFIDPETEDHRGLLVAIGQMKAARGFMARKKLELERDPAAFVRSMSIWESIGWDRYTDDEGKRRSFWYDTRRKVIVPPDIVAEVVGTNDDMIEVPLAYYTDFDNNPVKALRDLAGIPPNVNDPFISMIDRLDDCSEKWELRHGETSPVNDSPTNPLVAEWFRCKNNSPHVVHLDIAYSAKGDAAGIAMGHVSHLVDDGGEQKPYIVIDFVYRVKPVAGQELILADLRSVIYLLADRGFNIVATTMDGFQSKDTMQQLRSKGYKPQYLSVDRIKAPYEDLREAINERRIEFPKYMTLLKRGDARAVDIVRKELTELTDTGRKIDHPHNGSKDIADGIAGVTYKLMGNRKYSAGVDVEQSATDYAAAADRGEAAISKGIGVGPVDLFSDNQVSISTGGPMSLDQWRNSRSATSGIGKNLTKPKGEVEDPLETMTKGL